MKRNAIDDLIFKANEIGASDLHMIAGRPAIIRDINGVLTKFGSACLSSDQILFYAEPFFEEHYSKLLEENGDADLAYTTTDGIRVRINIFKSISGTNLAIRILHDKIPSMQTLNLPVPVQLISRKQHGLVLFSAPTGNGKTTSIAAILQSINESLSKRIITIEDPVEYIFPQSKSVISQREIGRDCSSFARGLYAALREDPDIIMIGEMRDAETILAAISAAESGHLVFSTLHSSNVVEAIDRLTQYFPPSQHDVILAQFANVFEAVVCQHLHPLKYKTGKIASFEVLLSTVATRQLIRNNQVNDLPGYMHEQDGMILMEKYEKRLREKQLI